MNRRRVALFFLTWAVLANALPAKKAQESDKGQKEEKKAENHDGKDKKLDLEEPEDEYDDDADEGDEIIDDYEVDAEQMMVCLNQENVTEAEMKKFLTSKTVENVGEAIKRAILCFLKSINFFDGNEWNVANIANAIGDNPKMFQTIKMCLEKADDAKLPPHERTYRVQKCVIELG